MCGIAGFIDFERRSTADEMRHLVQCMAGRLRHRGPDDQGIWIEAEFGVALGHTRLAVVELSAAGAQPMRSSCGRFVLSYNGEIYNADKLRAKLEVAGRRFRGHSDTEVLVEGFAVWGIRDTIECLIGMFAFAVWDRVTHTLTLARDRLGIKPLYYGRQNGRLLFASELKALTVLPDWQGELDRDALGAYLCYGYVPAPRSIYAGIGKLEPGTLLECGPDGGAKTIAYWSLAEVSAGGQASPLDISDAEAQHLMETLIRDAVARCMVADVPLGAFLSGGIDSSTVTALMQANSAQPIRTFTIGFEEEPYDEARHARQVAAHLGTDHTELYLKPTEVRAVISKLPEIYDEPFADSSQIPTYLVSEMTRRHVTVALSGDGGDELFAGYNRYTQGRMFAQAVRWLPKSLRAAMSSAIKHTSPSHWERAFRIVPKSLRPPLAGDKMHKLAEVLPEEGIGFYQRLVTQWAEAWSLVEGARELSNPLVSPEVRSQFADDISWMQYVDTMTYLPDDILTKVDRASMAVSLEVRVPLLDHRVVELAWRLPLRHKVRGGKSKWLLRQIAYKYVPKALLERPKMGFGIPIDAWLRGPLKEWAADLLNPSTMTQVGLLQPEPIRVKWDEHQSGRRNWQHVLWHVLMFEAWRRENANA